MSFRSSLRLVSLLPRQSQCLLPTARNAVPCCRPLSASASQRFAGQSDAGLAAKLKSELSYEQEQLDSDEPEFIQNFRSEGVWKLEDKEGFDEVALTRSFGNEDIRIVFSIADLDASPSAEEDGATNEEEEPAAEPASAESPAEDESLPVRTAITISKNGAGALTIDAVAQDGLFMIDSVAFYKSEKAAIDMSADGDWKRRALYMGPEFDALDEELQQEFESYLEERGINSNLSLFIPDLAEWKEQKEYVRWLEGVQGFIEA